MTARVLLLALAVALVLADSSVVTLGLPAVLGDFDASPEGVSWVLTAYNLVLAVAAIPAARLVQRSSATRVGAGGLLVFALASLLCAVAPSLGALIAARCLQGLGGAAAACAALPLLKDAHRNGVAIWGAAGAFGAAVGPAAGGILTEAFSWQAIFVVQIPVALLCIAAMPATRRAERPVVEETAEHPRDEAPTGALWSRAAGWTERAEPRSTTAPARQDPLEELFGEGWRPEDEEGLGAETRRGDVSAGGRPAEWRSLVALGFLGAGLTAALFLLVLLLIAGWRQSPIVAALTVSVMPLAALAAGRAGEGFDARARGASGAVLVAGGLAGLAFLPSSSIVWTIAPQILIGLGLGLSLAALTEAALHDRRPAVLHGAYTITARHVGVVAALALLTPIFVSDLERQERKAEEAIIAEILDSPIDPGTKLDLGIELAGLLDRADGEVPDTEPAFAAATPSGEDVAAYAALREDVDDELDRAAKAAFTRSFLIAALLSLGALAVLVRSRP